jgi:hypothetical protein
VEAIRFEYEHGEYARALRRHRMGYFHVARDLALCIAIAIAAYFMWNQGWPVWVASGAAALYVFIMALSVGVYPALAPRLRPHLNEPYTLSFSQREVVFSTPSVASRLPWSLYKSWSRDTDYIFLSLGNGHATIIPRRALNGSGGEGALLQLLTEKLGAERAA